MKRGKKSTELLALLLVLPFLLSMSSIGVKGAAAQGLGENVIKLGVAGALKRPYGIATVTGAEMASKEINAAGGVLGAKIQLFSADTEGTAPKATEAIEKLRYADKVDNIVGAFTSEEATAFQEESAKLKINILLDGAGYILDKRFMAEPQKYKYYWNYCPSENDYLESVLTNQLPLFVNTCKKTMGLGKVNVGILTDMALWTESMHAGYVKGVKANPDCNLVYVGKISRDATDFAAELTEMRTKEVQLVLTAMGYAACYTFIKQAYDVKLPAVIIGMNVQSWATSDFLKAVGVDAAAYNSTVACISLPTTRNTDRLLKIYERQYGGTFNLTVGVTYNGVKAYAKAVERAKSLDQDKVQKELEKVRLPESEVWGSRDFYFDDAHRVKNSARSGVILYTIQFTPNGSLIMIDPPAYKTGDLMLPPWMIKAWKK